MDNTELQISIQVGEFGSWPYDKLPAEIIPPDKGTLVGEVELTDTSSVTSETYSIIYDFDGLTDADVEQYIQQLIQNGWKGDVYMVKRVVEWKGKQYNISIEPMKYEGLTSFVCNVRLAE